MQLTPARESDIQIYERDKRTLERRESARADRETRKSDFPLSGVWRNCPSGCELPEIARWFGYLDTSF